MEAFERDIMERLRGRVLSPLEFFRLRRFLASRVYREAETIEEPEAATFAKEIEEVLRLGLQIATYASTSPSPFTKRKADEYYRRVEGLCKIPGLFQDKSPKQATKRRA